MTRNVLVPNLETQIDRLFDEAFRSAGRKSWTPACNAYEDEQGFSLQLALPGWAAQEIEVQVEDGVLTVKGERKAEAAESSRTYHLREMGWGAFSRSFTLPSYVEDGKASASFQQGILSIHLPKREEARPRRIMVETH